MLQWPRCLQIVKDTASNVESSLKWVNEQLYMKTETTDILNEQPPGDGAAASTSVAAQEGGIRKQQVEPTTRGVMSEIAHTKPLLIKAALQG